jgi:FMN-dependent NADH-azoreductase
MPTLLHLVVSPRGYFSISRRLSTAAVDAWKNKNPSGRVIERDLTKTEMTFVNLDWITGAFSTPDHHADSHKRALAISDELIRELLEADEIIVGTPMYNFAVPAVLKAWIDHVVRFGKTFT